MQTWSWVPASLGRVCVAALTSFLSIRFLVANSFALFLLVCRVWSPSSRPFRSLLLVARPPQMFKVTFFLALVLALVAALAAVEATVR